MARAVADVGTEAARFDGSARRIFNGPDRVAGDHRRDRRLVCRKGAVVEGCLLRAGLAAEVGSLVLDHHAVQPRDDNVDQAMPFFDAQPGGGTTAVRRGRSGASQGIAPHLQLLTGKALGRFLEDQRVHGSIELLHQPARPDVFPVAVLRPVGQLGRRAHQRELLRMLAPAQDAQLSRAGLNCQLGQGL